MVLEGVRVSLVELDARIVEVPAPDRDIEIDGDRIWIVQSQSRIAEVSASDRIVIVPSNDRNFLEPL